MSALGGLAQGFMQGYAFVDGIKQKKKDREREDEEYRQRQADRDAKKQQQAAAAEIISRVGTRVEEADIGGGIKTTGPQAGARAQQIIDNGSLADPEFGLDAQARMTNPAAQGINIKAQPDVTQSTYSQKEGYQDLAKNAAQAGDMNSAFQYQKLAKQVADEGFDRALSFLESGDVNRALQTYNETGADRIKAINPVGDGLYEIVNMDGSITPIDPTKTRERMLSIFDQARLQSERSKKDSYDALTDQRKRYKLSPGQIVRDPETNEIIAAGLPKPPPASRGGSGGGTGRTDNSARFRAETIRKLIAQNDKVIGSFIETPERKKAAADDNARLNRELMNTLIDGAGEAAPAVPEVDPSKVSKFVFDKATGRLVAKQ